MRRALTIVLVVYSLFIVTGCGMMSGGMYSHHQNHMSTNDND